ncbi:TPA: DUF1641 domain-containing protein [Candidatus Bathyarchaeota archaeon]|nr:DUF1641 domain-containing protein [Candidatus Bathyarchaeota archaeon]
MEKKIDKELSEETYETLIELLNSFGIVQNYLNDQVIEDVNKLLASMFKIVNIISSTDLVEILERALQDPNLDRALLNPPKIGLLGLMRALGEENVQKGLGVLIEILRAIGKASST